MATIKTEGYTTTLAEIAEKIRVFEGTPAGKFFRALNDNSQNLSDDPKVDFRVFSYEAMAAACEAAGIPRRSWWGRTWRTVFHRLRYGR